jgi:leader peptidase (prepilin peptidase)/N-methyltransferase
MLTSAYLADPSPAVTGLLRAAGLEIENPHVAALVASIAGAIVGGGLLWAAAEVYLRFRGIEGMGFGDVKLMAMVGAFLGAPLALLTIMLGSVFGSVMGLIFIRMADQTREYELPFGTFLSFAGIVAVLYGEDLVRWYVEHLIRPVS